MSSVNRHPGGRFPTRPPREFTPTPLGPRKCAAVVESIVVATGEDSSRDGGEGGLVTLSAVATVATVVGEGFVHSSVHSSDDEVVSVHSAQLLGVGVCDDSPNFSISRTKLRTVYGLNPAIEIGNTLKRKTGIPANTLGAIIIISCT